MAMITALAWIPRGRPAQFPAKYEFNQEELRRIEKLANQQLEDARVGLQDAKDKVHADPNENGASKKKLLKVNGRTSQDHNQDQHGDLAEYDLDNYDNEPASDEDAGESVLLAQGAVHGRKKPLAMFTSARSLAYHADNSEDPYITFPSRLNRALDEDVDEDEDELEEREEMQILPTDNLLVAGRVEDEVAHLEVYVCENGMANLYVHHDIMLPAVPLAVEPVSFPVGERAGDKESGNYVAIGTMESDIEIWNLDLVDSMYPDAVLGQNKQPGAPQPKIDTASLLALGQGYYHTDAVLALASNQQHPHLLASGSADNTIKLWDLHRAVSDDESGAVKAASTYFHHTDKVCALDWHPVESTVLLSGSYDQTVVASDMREGAGADSANTAKRRWYVDSDVESVAWNIHDPNYFFVSTESGMLYYFDARNVPANGDRKGEGSVWRLQAHSSALTSFAICPHAPGLVATGSDDKAVKVWNMNIARPSKEDGKSHKSARKAPQLLQSNTSLAVGRVFSVQFQPDFDPSEPTLPLAIGGSKGVAKVWDVAENKGVCDMLGSKAPRSKTGSGGKIISVDGGTGEKDSDSESGSDEEDEDEEDGMDVDSEGNEWEDEDEDDGEEEEEE